MKVLRELLRICAVLLGLALVAAFFFPLATLTPAGGSETELNGWQLAFGDGATRGYKSGYFFGSAVLTVLTAVFLLLGFFSKKKGWNGAAIVTGIFNTVLLILFVANPASVYVDSSYAIPSVANAAYTMWLPIALAVAVASVVFCVLGVLVKDAIRAKETGGLTIPARVFKFLREYKSELKKVVWPTGKTVVKNTLVVLAVCGVMLLLIWLVDWGLGELFKTVFTSAQ